MAVLDLNSNHAKKWVSLTGRCNNNCFFCLDKDRPDLDRDATDQQITSEIEDGFAKGAKRLVLSGGDPTVHPELAKWVKYGRDLGYERVQIVTNGRMLSYRSYFQKLVDSGLNEVTFSLHGHNREVHESHTRTPGSYYQIVTAIKYAVAAKLIVSTDTALTNKNYRYLPQIINLIYNLGVGETNVMSLVPFGSAHMNKNYSYYNFEDVVPFVQQAIKFTNEKKMVMWLHRFPPQYLEGYEYFMDQGFKIQEDLEAIMPGLNLSDRPDCYGERCLYCGIHSVCHELRGYKNVLRSEPSVASHLPSPDPEFIYSLNLKSIEGLDLYLNQRSSPQEPCYIMLDPQIHLEKENVLSTLAAVLENVLGKHVDKNYRLVDFPKCLFAQPALLKFHDDLKGRYNFRGFTSDHDAAHFVGLRSKYLPRKCGSCSEKNNCAGVFRDYLKFHGTEELKPLVTVSEPIQAQADATPAVPLPFIVREQENDPPHEIVHLDPRYAMNA